MTDTGTDSLWLTYAELADRLGIAADSARRLVGRKKLWARKMNNEGRTLVAVPVDYLEREARKPDAGPDIPPYAGEDAGADILPSRSFTGTSSGSKRRSPR